MRLIDADALMRDIEKYHLSDGKFQHWVEVQPTIEERKQGDLISRQAAIDVLSMEISLCVRISMMKRLPSAQPEIIRCKDCRHRIVNDHYGEKGYRNNNIKGYCELDTGDPFELGRNAQNDDWFCADAERRDD